MDPLPIFIIGIMIGSVGSLLGQAWVRRQTARTLHAAQAGRVDRDHARPR